MYLVVIDRKIKQCLLTLGAFCNAALRRTKGSGKNPSGNKVDKFAGNPHDRPGANAK
jgi:hypothetical protein